MTTIIEHATRLNRELLSHSHPKVCPKKPSLWVKTTPTSKPGFKTQYQSSSPTPFRQSNHFQWSSIHTKQYHPPPRITFARFHPQLVKPHYDASPYTCTARMHTNHHHKSRPILKSSQAKALRRVKHLFYHSARPPFHTNIHNERPETKPITKFSHRPKWSTVIYNGMQP